VDSRIIAVAGAVLVAGLGACSTPPAAVGTHTARVSINGKNISPPPAIRCIQQGWNWLVETPDKESGFRAAISTGDKITAQSVEIRGLDGFTGAFWEGTNGDGKATVDNGRITISGTAQGEFEGNSDEATATFDIETKC
jgi:hypothetical protein